MHDAAHHLSALPDVSDSSTAMASEEDEPLETWRTASSEANSNVIYPPSDSLVGALRHRDFPVR